MSWIAFETARLFWSTSFLVGPQLQVKTSIFLNPSDVKILSVCLSITFPHRSTRFFSSYLWAVGFVVHHYLWSLLAVPTLTDHFLYKQPADQKWTPDQVAVLCFAVSNGEMYHLAKQSSTLTVEQTKQRKKEVQSLDKWIWISQKFSTQTIQFKSESGHFPGNWCEGITPIYKCGNKNISVRRNVYQ